MVKNDNHLKSTHIDNESGHSKATKRLEGSSLHKEIDHNRTTLMLLIVCILFLMAEIPQAVLMFISIFNQDFYYDVYKPLGDLMDIFVLINYSINFLLYCAMSKDFRKTFSCYLKKIFPFIKHEIKVETIS